MILLKKIKETHLFGIAELDEAIKVTGAKTKKQVIAAGLKGLIRKKNLEAFRRELGIFDLALAIEDLGKLRNE